MIGTLIDLLKWPEEVALPSLKYAFNWTRAAPKDAYQAAEEYGVLVAVLSGFFGGVSLICWRLLVGAGVATINYALS